MQLSHFLHALLIPNLEGNYCSAVSDCDNVAATIKTMLINIMQTMFPLLFEYQQSCIIYYFFRSYEYFYLFQISYLWLCVLGFTICLLVGILSSLISTVVCGKSTKTCDSRMFVPPLASYLNKRHVSNNNIRKRQVC